MKKLIWVIIIVAVAVLLWWAFGSKPAAAPTTATNESATQTVPDQATAIQNDLQGLNTTDLNTEFNQIDTAAKSL